MLSAQDTYLKYIVNCNLHYLFENYEKILNADVFISIFNGQITRNIETGENPSFIRGNISIKGKILNLSDLQVNVFVRKVLSQTFEDFHSILKEIKRSSKTTDDFFSLVNKINERIFSFNPLTELEIEGFYNKLFLSSLSNVSRLMLNQPNFSCSVIHDLFTVMHDIQLNPSLKKGTGEGNTCAGVNGSYFLSNATGRKVWVMKPASEESKEKAAAGIPAGNGAKREHLAYILNPITTPFTVYAEIDSKVASLQRCIPNPTSLRVLETSNTGINDVKELLSFDLQISLLFDLRFNNWDRHKDNLLTDPFKHVWTIDNAGCMSSSSADCLRIEHFNLPQMKKDWDDNALKMILSLDENEIKKDAKKMFVHQIEENAIKRMEFATQVIVKLVSLSEESRKKNNPSLTPFDIAWIFLKYEKMIWLGKDIDFFTKFGQDIINNKKACEKLNYGRAKFILERRKFINENQDKKELADMLFGADQSSTDSHRIEWEDSIIAAYLKYYKE